MVEIRQCSIRDLFARQEFIALRDEYIAEGIIQGMPHPVPQPETYERLEEAGILTLLCAFCGETLVGFVTLITAPIPHYGIPMLVTESIFVGKDHRKTGAGLSLLRAAEEHAKHNSIRILQVSAQPETRLERVLAGRGYAHTNIIFTKLFSHA